MKKETEKRATQQRSVSDFERTQSHIEIDNGSFITVDGCKAVLRYGDEHILLSLGARSLQIIGSQLCISNMFGETICISGRICSLEYLYGR